MNAVVDALKPPWSAESEQSVLGALMLDAEALDSVTDVLTADVFFDCRHRAIFAAMLRLGAGKSPIDPLTVFGELQASQQAEDAGGLQYLTALLHSVTSARNVRRYAETVREKAAQRALISAADWACERSRGSGVVAEKLDEILTALGRLEREQVRKCPRSLAEIAIQRTDHYEALERGEVDPGWATGLHTLDRLLNGGLRPGGLYILAARPKVGKSSLAQHIATTQAREGRSTLLLSQEMPDIEVADRGVSSIGRVDYSALLSGRMTRDDWSRAADALQSLSGMPLYVDDQPALKLGDIKAKARSVHGLKVLVLDYLQLCSGSTTRRETNRNADIEEITRGLKTFAKNEGIAILALSQLSRAVETRGSNRPRLSDLRDSGAIEQDADVVVFLWTHREVDEGVRIVGCAVDANRQGANGAFALHFDGSRQSWGESSESLMQKPFGSQRSDL